MRRFSLVLICPALLLAGCEYFIGQPPKIASLTIEPGPAVSVVENGDLSLKAVARDGNGEVMPDVQVDWLSEDWGIAYVDYYTKQLRGVRPGTTVIEAHAGSVVATATVTVTPGVVKSVYVNPNRFVIAAGQRVQLFVNAQDARAFPLRDRFATFTSLNSVATVTPDGMVTGITPGLATIVVAVDDVSFNVLLRVSQPSLVFDFYKRGGTTTPGKATLTFAPSNINRGTLAIDGRSIPVVTAPSYDTGVTCMMTDVTVAPIVDPVTRCVFDALPLTMRLCTPLNGNIDPGQLQYVLMPATDSGRVPATASALLAAVQSNTQLQGINVHSGCTTSFTAPGSPPTPRWVRASPGTDFYLWPNITTVYSAASVATLLDGAAIFSAPGAGTSYSRYVAVRVTSTIFEIWH